MHSFEKHFNMDTTNFMMNWRFCVTEQQLETDWSGYAQGMKKSLTVTQRRTIQRATAMCSKVDEFLFQIFLEFLGVWIIPFAAPLAFVALRKPRTFNTVSHQNASDPVAPLQAQGAPFSGQWVGKGFSAWPFSFGRARRPLERLIGISRIAGGIEAGIIYHCLFLGVVKPWSLAIVEKVAVLRRSCQWGWTSLVNHNISI